jgi:hypothetical protein
MKFFAHFLPSFIFISAGTVSMGLPALSQNEQNQPAKSLSSESYKVHFLSTKRGHKIAPSYFNFEDQKKFKISMPGEEFLESKGNYAKDNLQFKAHWEGSLIKNNKHYSYTFTITGISLLKSYIAGVIVLSESIKETQQDQEITFLFIGMPEENDSSQNNQKQWFPF